MSKALNAWVSRYAKREPRWRVALRWVAYGAGAAVGAGILGYMLALGARLAGVR